MGFKNIGEQIDKGVKFLRILRRLGVVAVFLLNVILVIGLAAYCCPRIEQDKIVGWVGNFVLVAIILFGFACLGLVLCVYLSYRHVGEVTNPLAMGEGGGARGADQEVEQTMEDEIH